MLRRRFVSEPNTFLKNAANEVKQKLSSRFMAETISQLDEFDFFLKNVLVKIVSNVNRVLRLRTRKKPTLLRSKAC